MNTSFHRIGIVLVAAGLIAGCGSDDGGSAATPTPPPEAPATSATTEDAASSTEPAGATAPSDEAAASVRMTYIGFCGEVGHWAEEQGVFSDHGVDVEFVSTTGGAAALDAVEADAADIAYVNTFTVLKAIEAGRDLVIVGAAGQASELDNGVLVTVASGVNSPKDLAGKQVGVNEIGGFNHVVAAAWIEQDGGDSDAAEFVALPFPELFPAVEGGQVDAAFTSPTNELKVKEGTTATPLKVLGHPIFEVVGAVPTAVYAAKRSFVEDGDAVQSWIEAMDEAVTSFENPANFENRVATMAPFCKTEPDTLRTTPFNPQEALVDVDGVQRLIDLLGDRGVLDPDLTAADLVAAAAQG